MKSKTPPTDAAIDSVIRKNLRRFAKPGVVSVRPGLRISKGMLTNEPAIVASVRRKIANIPPKEKLPTSVGGMPVDVRACVDTNRDASVVITNPEMVTYWEAIFLSDWQSMTLPNEDPPS